MTLITVAKVETNETYAMDAKESVLDCMVKDARAFCEDLDISDEMLKLRLQATGEYVIKNKEDIYKLELNYRKSGGPFKKNIGSAQFWYDGILDNVNMLYMEM